MRRAHVAFGVVALTSAMFVACGSTAGDVGGTDAGTTDAAIDAGPAIVDGAMSPDAALTSRGAGNDAGLGVAAGALGLGDGSHHGDGPGQMGNALPPVSL